jgi:hypothetical protein
MAKVEVFVGGRAGRWRGMDKEGKKASDVRK